MRRINVRRGRHWLAFSAVGALVAGVAVHAASSPPGDWKANIAQVLGRPTADLAGVLTYLIPRDDINVTVDGMAVPTGAGIDSRLTFFACSCGKTRAVGQFCCTGDEVNELIDALRCGGVMEIASIAPMFTRDQPHLMLVRFQGEGEAGRLAEAVQAAFKALRGVNSTTRPAG